MKSPSHITCLLVGITLASEAWALQPISTLPLQPVAANQWLLPAGEYQGQFSINETMTLRCAPGAVLDAQGMGDVLRLQAPDIRIEDCSFRNWGRDLTAMNAEIVIESDASGSVIENNELQGVGFGIRVERAKNVTIRANRIQGDESIRSQDRGNDIHLFNTSGTLVSGNEIWHTRDGVYIDTSNQNRIENNFLHDLRYGVHYMFANANEVVGNHTLRTRTGYALMQSRQLTVVGNRSEDDQNYGILMNYITYSTIRDNVVSRVHRGDTGGDTMITGGEGKALFIYNSLFNTIEGNRFEHSNLGVHLTAGSENNKISGNAFVGNEQQVKYVATRTQEWSQEGQGNYWSDYLGWDRNGDGIGDVPYEPNDNVDRLLWTYPEARLLMNSPAIELLRWVQRAFPVIKSPGVQDSFPLMKAPSPAKAGQAVGRRS